MSGRRPAVVIIACPNGPLLVRGDVEIRDEAGRIVEPHRQSIALCRCGASTIRPFCDGSHKLIGFETTPPARTSALEYDDNKETGA